MPGFTPTHVTYARRHSLISSDRLGNVALLDRPGNSYYPSSERAKRARKAVCRDSPEGTGITSALGQPAGTRGEKMEPTQGAM